MKLLASTIGTYLFVSTASALAMGSVIAEKNDWTAVEHEDAGIRTCSLNWEPVDTDFRYSIGSNGLQYNQYVTGLNVDELGKLIKLNIVGPNYSSIHQFYWDDDQGAYKSDLLPKEVRAILNMPSKKPNASISIRFDKTDLMTFSMNDAEEVAVAMSQCSNALLEGLTDGEDDAEVLEPQTRHEETIEDYVAEKDRELERERQHNPEFVQETDPVRFIAAYQQQFQRLPGDEQARRMMLTYGYMFWIQAKLCAENGWLYTDATVADLGKTVSNLISQEGISKDVADYVWKANSYLVQSQPVRTTPSECQKTVNAVPVYLGKYAVQSAVDVPNPFTR